MLDTVAPHWDKVSVGTSKIDAIQLLGSPDSHQSIDIPIVSADVLIWSSLRYPRSKTYVLLIAANKVIAKSIVQ
jgi:hypothetical protein